MTRSRRAERTATPARTASRGGPLRVLPTGPKAIALGLALLASPGIGGCDRADDTLGAPSDSTGLSLAARTYSSPPEAELRFHALVPEGVVVRTTTTGPGYAVSFTGRTNDDPEERAFLHFSVAREGATLAAARETVHAAAEAYRVPGDRSELERVPPPPWAVEKYPIRSEGMIGDTVTGWIALGSHAGRWFHIIVQHPARLEDEFTPRVDRILSSWRWADDGEPLRREAAGSPPP